jgi:sugar O-acyltransferase (sialic acid O-acetyltransferase NeuD family)
MKKLAILGYGGHGRVVADIANECGWKKINFFDEDDKISSNLFGSQDDFFNKSKDYDGVFIAIGSNSHREKAILRLKNIGANLINIIHPSAYIGSNVILEQGIVAMPKTVINTSCKIGIGVILNTGCTIDHDCEIGNYCHISPGVNVAGGVLIGCNTWIGINACVKDHVSLGSNILVGAGAAVISNIEDNMTVAGIPAREIK